MFSFIQSVVCEMLLLYNNYYFRIRSSLYFLLYLYFLSFSLISTRFLGVFIELFLSYIKSLYSNKNIITTISLRKRYKKRSDQNKRIKTNIFILFSFQDVIAILNLWNNSFDIFFHRNGYSIYFLSKRMLNILKQKGRKSS